MIIHQVQLCIMCSLMLCRKREKEVNKKYYKEEDYLDSIWGITLNIEQYENELWPGWGFSHIKLELCPHRILLLCPCLCSCQNVCEAPLQYPAHSRLWDVNCVRYCDLVCHFYTFQFWKIFWKLVALLYFAEFSGQQYEESVEIAINPFNIKINLHKN